MPVVTYRLRSSRKEFWIISNTWRCRAGSGGAWQGKFWLGLATAYSGFYEASVRCGTARWGGARHGSVGSCRAGSGAVGFGKVWADNSG